MNPWAVDPCWQNFSSLYREAVTTREAKTGMERSHHLTASLYFGIAALEASLNKKMRDRLKGTKSEEEVFDILRKGKILSKIKKWPEELLGKPVPLQADTLALLSDFNDIRGDPPFIICPTSNLIYNANRTSGVAGVPQDVVSCHDFLLKN